MKELNRLIKSDKGEALIKVMCICLAAFMLLVAVYQYTATIAVAKKVEDIGQLMLDTYTIKTGKEIVHQVKSGNDFTKLLNHNLFLRDYYKALEINEEFESVKYGRRYFKLTEIDSSFIFDKSLKTSVAYTITLPLYFLGVDVYDIAFQVNLESRYNLCQE